VLQRLSFGPTGTPVPERTVALRPGNMPKTWRGWRETRRATFRLGSEETHGRAMQLVRVVYGWRATTMEPSGSQEYRAVISRWCIAPGSSSARTGGHVRRTPDPANRRAAP
jgi:hypothetical protein